MSSIVCQGLQSCLESPLLNNKLAPPRPNFSQFPSQKGQEEDDDDKEAENRGRNDNLGGWSFIQALTHMSQTPNEIIKGTDGHEKVYVHPMDKNSSSILSKKSLEMCTESLGSESGSDSGESIEELSLPLNLIQRSRVQELHSVKKKETRVFPPPISSIRGSDIVQVLPTREGGRLLIKAVTVTYNNGYFQADRSDGRLRLSLFTESNNLSDDDDEDEHEQEDHKDEDEEEEREIGISNRLISSCKDEDGNGKESMSNWGPFWMVIS